MPDLRISPDLALPYDVITQTIGIFARKGAGKTYTAKRIVEEVVKARLPVVVLDPLGAWWGLRSSADGERPGLPVIVLGGEHAVDDVALSPASGGLIADLVIENPGAYVLDLSDFASDAEQDRFASAFMQRLYRGKARNRDPLLLVVDEADAFAPQQGQRDQAHMVGAAKTIARRARLRGIGSMWITQRPAVLHADIRAMVELLIVLQVTGKHDREALDAWLKGKTNDEERDTVIESLASLQTGELWASSPSWLGILVRTKASLAETFDSSKTPEVGEVRIEPRAFAQVDLGELSARIASMDDEVKANDPVALRKRITELEKGAPAGKAEVRVETVERIVEVPVLNGQVDKLLAALTLMSDVGDRLTTIGRDVVEAAQSIDAKVTAVRTAPRPGQQLAQPVPSAGSSAGRTEAPDAVAPVARAVGTLDASGEPGEAPRLKAGARRMLSALAWFHPTPLTRAQLAMLSDVSPVSGTVSDYLSTMRQAGLIVEEGGTVALSDTGVFEVGPDALSKRPPSTADLVATWGRRLKLGARRMLDALVAEYPRPFSRRELASAAEVSEISGTVSDYLSSLRRAGLIDERPDGIRANENLFLGRKVQ